MKLIKGPCCSSKTTNLIKQSAETGYYMVVLSREESSKVFQLADTLGLDIPFPITFNEFINGKFSRRGCKGFLIDNVDLLLMTMAQGVHVEAVTFNENRKQKGLKCILNHIVKHAEKIIEGVICNLL